MREEKFLLSKIETYKNMPAIVAESLKEAIVCGTLKGGVQLKQEEIARQFDVSLIPVREALIQLEKYHLVRSIRNKGTLVTRLSLTEMHQLFEMRKVIELGSVMLIKWPIPLDKLEKMKHLILKMEKTQEKFSLSRYNRLFYLCLCDLVDNMELYELYEQLFVRIERYLNSIYIVLPELACDFSHYYKVIQLLETNQLNQLILVLREHVEQTEVKFKCYLEEINPTADSFDWNCLLPLE